jgi:hypothetical protein
LKETKNIGSDKMNSFGAGSYISYIVTASKKGLEGIAASEFTGDYDRDYYWSACYDPSKRILEQVFKEIDWDELLPHEEVEANRKVKRNKGQSKLDL